MSAVWVVRYELSGEPLTAFIKESDAKLTVVGRSGYTVTRETLLTPAQAAVIAAAKAYVDFMHGFREATDAVPFVDGLMEAVTTLRAQEGE